MKHPMKLSLAIALALGSPAAWALGLGGITVKSGLNEPLVAEIVINEAAPGEADGVRANLASAEDFARVGLDLSGVSVPLAFDVVKDDEGRAIIQVSSESPVREPFLSFLVEVSWSKGRLLREYTVLLDPPVVAPAVIGTRTVVEPVREAAPAPAPEPLPPSARDAAPAAEAPAAPPAAETAPPAATPAPAVEPAPAPVAAAPSAPGEYGPVAAGETLWEIATATRPERDITLNQMMVAIVRANPDAFVRGNANQLKRGAVLRIPAADEARAIAVADAAAEIAAQNDAWQGSRAPTLVADSGTAAPAGRTPAPTPSRDDSRLELVPPRAGAGSTGSGADRPGTAAGTDTSAVSADLARAREQLASREQEAGELRSRVQELERIQQDKDRLVNLKDSEIAELQRRLAEMQAEVERQKAAVAAAETAAPVAAEPTPAPAEPTPVAAEPAPAEPAPAEPVAAEPAPAEPVAGTEPPAGTETTPATESAPAEPVAATEPAPAEPAVTPVPEPAPAEAAPIETPVAMPWWRENLALIGASGALLLGGILLLAMRGRRKPMPKPVAAAAGGGSVADSFGDSVFGGEAGDGEERELLDRLASDPTDLESHLALLRHYHGAGDAEKFEGAANAMYAQLSDTQEPAWVEACMLGRELLPGNPLFEPADEAPQAFDFDAVETAQREPEPGFDLGTPEIEKIEPAAEPEPFDFSLEEPTLSKTEDFKASAQVTKPADDLFRTAEFEAPRLDLEPPAPAPAAEEGFFEGEDAVGTKLDLARAYLDMGDPEGARSMLQEVIAEGSEVQKQEARRLLADIG
jgi:pilus assembly protein FimV